MELKHNSNALPGSPTCARTYAFLSSDIRKLTGSGDAQMTMGYIVSKLLYSLNPCSVGKKSNPNRHHTVFKGRPYFRCNEGYLAEQLGYSKRQASNILQMLRDGYGLITENTDLNYEMFIQNHADRTHCMTITDEGLKYYPELAEEIDRWQFNNPSGYWLGPPKRKKRKKAEPQKAPEQKTDKPAPTPAPKEEAVAYSNITNLSIQGPNDGLPF